MYHRTENLRIIKTDAKRHAVSAICAKQGHMSEWFCQAGLSKVWEDIAVRDCVANDRTARLAGVCPLLERGGR